MKQYLNLLNKILSEGTEKESGRANMPNTFGISKSEIEMNMDDGFPLLTTKKVYWKGVVTELLWFLHGDTNIKNLVDNNVHIWDQDAYRWYLKFVEKRTEPDYTCMVDDPLTGTVRPFTFEEFVDIIKAERRLYIDSGYHLGDLGKVYGYQWRRQEKLLPDGNVRIIDQVADVVNGLQTNPYSRYHIIDAWNKGDFVDMALPPCHVLYQFIVRPFTESQKQAMLSECLNDQNKYLAYLKDQDWNKISSMFGLPKFYLDLNMYQRSCDTFLGVPFNLASMSLLLHIIAKTCNMKPGIANWIGGDTHVYVDHIPAVTEQLSRTPGKLPVLTIGRNLSSLEDVLELTYDDFQLSSYEPQSAIKAELFTGIKK